MSHGRKLFGTDGVRGRANVHPMTAEMALSLGQAIAYVFRGRGGNGRRRILIGKDTRLSGYMFEDALAAGISSMGVNVIQVGPMPTPALAFLTADMRCDAGVMISASHNTYQDNGIKFFGSDGFKLADELEERIEDLIASGELAGARAGADEVGQARRIDDAEGRYIVSLKKTFPMDLALDGLRVVLDCANGAAYKVGPTVLSELGAEVFALGVEPNGRNINENCGSLHPEVTAAKLREVRADVGIAVDGDADRVVMVDEKGEVLDGDMLIALLAREMHDRKTLKGGGVVATVMSNIGLEVALREAGIDTVRCAVGDKHVMEEMMKRGLSLGGEQSGHVIFSEYLFTGDGLATSLNVLRTMAATGRELPDLASDLTTFPQVLMNVHVERKVDLKTIPEVAEVLSSVESRLAGNGRLLVRYSGTEPLLRVMLEGLDEGDIRRWGQEIIDVVKEYVESP